MVNISIKANMSVDACTVRVIVALLAYLLLH